MTVSDLIKIINHLKDTVYFNKCRPVFDRSFIHRTAVISRGSCGAVGVAKLIIHIISMS